MWEARRDDDKDEDEDEAEGRRERIKNYSVLQYILYIFRTVFFEQQQQQQLTTICLFHLR